MQRARFFQNLPNERLNKTVCDPHLLASSSNRAREQVRETVTRCSAVVKKKKEEKKNGVLAETGDGLWVPVSNSRPIAQALCVKRYVAMMAHTQCGAIGHHTCSRLVCRCILWACALPLGVPYQIGDASPFCRDPIVPPVIPSLSSLREMDMEEARNADSLLYDHLWVN